MIHHCPPTYNYTVPYLIGRKLELVLLCMYKSSHKRVYCKAALDWLTCHAIRYVQAVM